MIKYELYKVVTRKLFLVMLAVAVAVNALALWWLNPPPDGMSHSEVKEIYDIIRPLPVEEKLEFLNSIPGDLSDSIIRDLTVNTYTAYLDRIYHEADILLGSAVFGGDSGSFSYRNIEKTGQDFAGMRDIKTYYDVNTGLAVLFDSPSADIIIVFLIITICIALITDEKDKRLFMLIKATPNGHIHTVAAKLVVAAICVAGVSGLVYLSGLIFTEATFGLGDISRPVQSVPDLMGSLLSISVAGFILLNFIAKTAGLLCIAMLIMLIAIHAKHSIIMISATVIIAAVSNLLAAIPVSSQWNALRFLNLYSLIVPHRIYGDYFNLNVFGMPVSLIPVFIIFTAILFMALVITVCLSFIKKRGLETTQGLFMFKELRLIPSRLHTNWKYFELKKLAFVNKALMILVIFGVIQGYSIYTANEALFGFEHYYVKNTLLRLQGELTEEKETVILAEKVKYDHAQSEIDRFTEAFYNGEIDITEFFDEIHVHSETMQIMQGFLIVYERYEYVRDNLNAEFLYDAGYARLFGLHDSDSGLNAGMRLITVLLLCLCGVFSIEYKTGMYKVLNSTVHGHSDTVRFKLILSVSLTVIAFVLTCLPDFIYIGQNYGYAGLTSPLASIPPADTGQIPAFIGSLPVWSYIAALLILRLIVFTAIAIIILAISLFTGNNAYAALAGAGIMLLPLFLHLFGFNLFYSVSLLNLVTVNGIIVAPGILKAVQVIIFTGVSVMSLYYIKRKFGKAL